MTDFLFLFSTDCEALQPAVRDADLGERSSRGIAEVLERHQLRGTFYVIPADLAVHGAMYRELEIRGHEVGLHIHPAAQGYNEFLGVHGPDDQRKILSEAADRFADAMGRRPISLSMGYASINDYTFSILAELGFRQGCNTIPSRVLPECASVHAGAPLDPHYAHRFNRVLVGDLDFIEVPHTLDPDSRMWGGKHPLDLRIELVDAKNHFYTIDKAIRRQLNDASIPVKSIRVTTHNTFDFSAKTDFRRETMEGVIQHTQQLAAKHGVTIKAATVSELAAAYRKAVPLGSTATQTELDRRGYRPPTSNVGAGQPERERAAG